VIAYGTMARRKLCGCEGMRRERNGGVAAVMVGGSVLLRASERVVFGADCARRESSARLGFGARLRHGLSSRCSESQEATMGGFNEPSWARFLLFGAGCGGLMCIHERGPHGGLLSCGCSEGGAGLCGVVRSLFSGFGLLLLDGIVRAS
jgi:hypothetical protein